MGWLQNAHRSGRIRLGGSPSQRRGPLRKIVDRLEIADSIFAQDKVKLECGHVVMSNGIYKARCTECTDNKKAE